MFLLKTIGVLLSFLGVTELSVQYTYKQSTPTLVQEVLSKYTFSSFKQSDSEQLDSWQGRDHSRGNVANAALAESFGPHHHHQHGKEEEGPQGHHHPHHGDGEEEGHHGGHHHGHHGDHGEEHQGGHHHHRHEDEEEAHENVHHEGHFLDAALGGLKVEMQVVKECHHRCGHCGRCHAHCPKPWGGLASQCDSLQPIWACHKQCGHDTECHARCALPKSNKWTRMMQEASECHGSCKEGDHDCHRQCPHPLRAMANKCGLLSEKMACHERCSPVSQEVTYSSYSACHHACPKMMGVFGRGEKRFEQEDKPQVVVDPFHV